jgi:hypothetical protein
LLQTLIESSLYPQLHDIHECIRGIFLFGTPHQGLRTAELCDMVDEETDYALKVQHLLAQLSEGSEFLENQRDALTRVWNDFRGIVCTFYETQWSKSVKKVGIP